MKRPRQLELIKLSDDPHPNIHLVDGGPPFFAALEKFRARGEVVTMLEVVGTGQWRIHVIPQHESRGELPF